MWREEQTMEKDNGRNVTETKGKRTKKRNEKASR